MLSLLCLSDRSHRVTLIFKNTKNSFLSFLVSVRPSTSCDTYFQVIQKIQKKYIKFQKNIKISTLLNKYLLRTTWSLILPCEIRRSKASSCQVHFRKIKSFPQMFFFSNIVLKNYVTLISHFEWEYVGPRSILVGPKKLKNIFVSF